MESAAKSLYGSAAPASTPASKPAAQQPNRDEMDIEAAARTLYGPKTPAARKTAAKSSDDQFSKDSINPMDSDPAAKLYGEIKKPELDEHGYIRRSEDKAKDGEDGEDVEKSDAKDRDADKAKQGAPENYDIKAPEGMELDQEALGEFAPIAKELKLTNEQAQKLADVHSKTLQRQTETYKKMTAEWRKESEKQFDTLDIFDAKNFIKSMNDPELSKVLIWSGLGNHKSVIRALAEAGAIVRRSRTRA